MNKYSPKLEELRARVLDTETLLHFMRDRDNLQTLLDHGCPQDTVGAMIDGAYSSISDANELCQALLEARDEDFRAEYKETAIDAMNNAGPSNGRAHDESQEAELVEADFDSQEPLSKLMQPVSPFGAVKHLNTLDEIHEQSAAMLNMLMLNHRHAGNGEESLADSVLESYAWQLVDNMKRAAKATQALADTLKREASHE